MNLALAILAFNIIVIVHELGHFLTARKMGIKVLEFSLFVGPRIFSIKRGETTYSLRLIPIMAYVKMEGEDEASNSEGAFGNKPKYARALTTVGGPLANLLLAVVLLTAVFAIEGYSSTEISRVAVNSPAASAGMRPGDKIVSYDGKKTFLPIDVVQFLYVSRGVPAKVEYERDGKRFSETLAPVVHPASSAPKIGVSLANGTEDSNVITAISAGLPAERIGLLAGDRIVGLNDIAINTADELIAFINQNGLKPVHVTVKRGESQVNVTLTPVKVKTEEWYDIGMAFSTKKGGILESIVQSAVFTCSIVRSVGYSLIWLITGKARLNEVTGPIGIVSAISSAVQQAPGVMEMLLYLMNTTAFMSIAIGASNLIPFPALDGGRLVLIGLEAIRGKPLSQEKEAYISIIGFTLIILLGVYAAYNDIVKLIAG